jgi:hypothetical protein
MCRNFCRINGDPSISEAADLVHQASRAGCMPNEATVRELTALAIRHEQLAGADCRRDPRALSCEPYLTP